MNSDVTKSNVQSDGIILAIENYESWCKLREEQDRREDTDKSCDLASQHERNLWKLGNLKDIKLDDLLDPVSNNDNFEEHLGIFGMLGSNLSRKSSPEETNASYRSNDLSTEKKF